MPPGERLDDRIEQWMAHRLGSQSYQGRLKGKVEYRIAGDALVVTLANPLLMQWVQARHAPLLNELAAELIGPGARVEFHAAAVRQSEPSAAQSEPVEATPTLHMPGVHHQSAPSDGASSAVPAMRRRGADFSDFIVGETNRLAYTAARQVAESPGTRLNPLFLYGGVGVGKSHVVEGVVRDIRTRQPALQVLHVSAEGFLNYFTEAMKSHSTASFRQRFRKVDVLIIEDIEFLCGKRASREEFLNTVKKLSEDGCQMVFTADRHPRLLEGMGDDLISRLMSGMVCRIESPDQATRRGIAAQLAQRLSFAIGEDVLDDISQRFRLNAREIQGAVNSLYAHALVSRERLNLRIARKILAQFEGSCQRIVRITDVEQAVCGVFRVTPQELRSGERKQTVCYARHMAIYLSRRLTGAAFSEIGTHFGNRNHSTIITSNDKIKSMIANQGSIRLGGSTWLIEDLVESLEQQILAS